MLPVRQEIEVVLTRQLATCLSTPVFLVDVEGTLLFYNEPAETILGHRFEDTGEMRAEEWTTVFHPTDDAGVSIHPEKLPLVVAIREGRTAHLAFWINGMDGKRRQLEVTAFPLIPRGRGIIGGVAIFWERT
jgi:PAS domain-containing protein